MILKKLAISVAAGALLLASATGVFASHKTVTITSAEVNNHAKVTNVVFTASNTGLNQTNVSGGDTTSTTSSETKKAEGGDTTGGNAAGGNAALVTTGDAGSVSTVSNTVNTTTVSF